MFGVSHLAGAQLRLAQPQHRDAELLHHRVVVEHGVLELAVDVPCQLAGVDAVVRRHRLDRKVAALVGHRMGDRLVGGADLVRGQPPQST